MKFGRGKLEGLLWKGATLFYINSIILWTSVHIWEKLICRNFTSLWSLRSVLLVQLLLEPFPFGLVVLIVHVGLCFVELIFTIFFWSAGFGFVAATLLLLLALIKRRRRKKGRASIVVFYTYCDMENTQWPITLRPEEAAPFPLCLPPLLTLVPLLLFWINVASSLALLITCSVSLIEKKRPITRVKMYGRGWGKISRLTFF